MVAIFMKRSDMKVERLFVMNMDRNFIHASGEWEEEQDGMKIMMIVEEVGAVAEVEETEEHQVVMEAAGEDLQEEVHHPAVEEAVHHHIAVAQAEEVLDLCLVKK
jgi:hypothetical protein